MMEFKNVIETFKNKHTEAGKPLRLSLLPFLMKELIDNGLNVSHADGKFYKTLAEQAFGSSKELQTDVIDALLLFGQMLPLPKQVEEPKQTETVAIVDDDIIRTDHLVANIPREEDEGDPFYIAPEDRINLRPEDFAPMEYDEEFCARIGATKDRR